MPPAQHALSAHVEAKSVRGDTPCGPGTLAWRRWGSGRPVVLLHGGGGSWTHWIKNIEALSESNTLWIPDLPGHGDSSLPSDDREINSSVEAIQNGIDHVIGQPYVLIGFSYGGLLGGLLAAARPDTVSRLILVGAPGLGLYSRSDISLVSWRKLSDPAQREEAHRQNLQKLMFSDSNSVDALSVALYAANTERDRLKHRSGMIYSDENVLRKKLPRITCPLYGIWGREDALYRASLDALPLALSEAPDFRELELIENAGHWVSYEGAPRFNQTVLRMLTS